MQENKTRILNEAEALFKKKGIRSVSIDDICHQVGISKKTFYQYYGQKEDLIEDVISLSLESVQKGIEEYIAGHDPVDGLLCLSELSSKKVSFLEKNRMAEEIEKYYPDTFVKAEKNRTKIIMDLLLAFISKGVDEGYFRKDIDQNAALKVIMLTHYGMGEYYSEKFVVSGKKLSRKAMSSAFVDMIQHLLLSPEGWKEFERRNAERSKTTTSKSKNSKQKNNKIINIEN